MMHIPDGVLRARMDGELTDPALVERHLAGCARCREREEAIRARAGRVQGLLAVDMRPIPGFDAAESFARLQRRLGARSIPRGLPMRWTRPAWALAASLALIAVLFTSAPARAVAQKLLSLFRVKAVVAVPLEHDYFAGGKGGILRELLSDGATVLKDEQPVAVASRDEAARLAGFEPRLPSLRQDAPKLRVEGARSFYLTVKKQRVEEFLKVVNRVDIALPPEMDGARVQMDVPRALSAAYGDCPSDSGPLADPAKAATCAVLLQAPSIRVLTQPAVDLAQLAEIGLQLSGMTVEQARQFSATIDWTSTLAVPIPRESATYETVNVDGVRGILIQGRPYSNWPLRWSLIWVRDGRMYWLSGLGDTSVALALAESLQ